jgi:flagellar basal-body rod protein FlgB
MAISNDTIYGGFAQALKVHGQRMGEIANNLANADTPGYKARDIDFRAVLSTTHNSPAALKTSSPGHISAGTVDTPTRVWRVASQPSADGNTVDAPMEQARFAEASLRYEATLRFIDGRVKGLLTAITGQ